MYKNEYLEECIKSEQGSLYLLRGYIHTQNNRCKELVISDLGFICNHPEELKTFKSELLKANIKDFVLTQRGSALMEIILELDSVGIKIKEVTSVTYIDKYEDKEGTFKGIKMSVCE